VQAEHPEARVEHERSLDVKGTPPSPPPTDGHGQHITALVATVSQLQGRTILQLSDEAPRSTRSRTAQSRSRLRSVDDDLVPVVERRLRGRGAMVVDVDIAESGAVRQFP
jgi:hypothetical protein